MSPPTKDPDNYHVFDISKNDHDETYVVMRDKKTNRKFWCPINMLSKHVTYIGANKKYWYSFKQTTHTP